MSRRIPTGSAARRLLVAVWIGLSPWAGTGSLSAQDQEPRTREAVGQRIEALRPLWEESSRRADQAEKLRQDSIRAENIQPQDTVMVGPITVVTPAGQGELAREFFEEPVAALVPIIKGKEHLLEGHVWAFSYFWSWKHLYVDAEYLYDVTLNRRYSRARVTERVRHTLGHALLRNLPASLGDLGGLASHQSVIPGSDPGRVYRRLATAQFLSAKECLSGDLAWCWEAVGLVSETGGEDWSTPARRRALVSSRYERELWDGEDRFSTQENLLRGCLILDDDRACQLLLDGHHLGTLAGRHKDYTVPLDASSRGTLLSEALRLGGEGSFGRLIAAEDASVQERLAAASGMSPDELMAEWLSGVKEARPNAQAGLLLSPVSLLFWMALLVFLSTRSSRWRLG